MIAFNLTCFICCLVLIFLNYLDIEGYKEHVEAYLTFILIAPLCFPSYSLIGFYLVKFFPPEVKGFGVGIVMLMAHISSIFIPYIFLFFENIGIQPMVGFALFSGLAFPFALFLKDVNVKNHGENNEEETGDNLRISENSNQNEIK